MSTKSMPLRPLWLPNEPTEELFVGRRDTFERLNGILFQGPSDAIKSVTLYGPPGIGKTTVAKAYPRSGYDVAFWLDASDAEQMKKSVTEIRKKLGLEDLDALKTWLAKPVKELLQNCDLITKWDPGEEEVMWLLVFDGIEDPEVLNEWWPVKGKKGSIIFTSRDPRLTPIDKPKTQVIHVSGLSEAESYDC